MKVWDRVKIYLKKLFPAPAESFHARMEAEWKKLELIQQQQLTLQSQMDVLSSANKQAQDILAALKKKDQDIFDLMEQQKRAVTEEVGVLKEKLMAEIAQNRSLTQAVSRDIGEKAWLYQNDLEYRYYHDFLSRGIRSVEDFENRFLRLVHGLDLDSIETVVRIFQRMDILYRTDPRPLDLFTKEEQKKLWEMKDRFSANRFQVSDSLFYYQGFMLPYNQFESCVFYGRHGLELVRHPEAVRNRDIIDAGAFIGDSALIFSPLTDKKVYSFEPSSENLSLMERTITLNNLKNVITVPMALSDKKETLTFSLGGSSSNSLANRAFQYKGETRVEATTLDDFVIEHNLDVGLIKTDLEGVEQLFLKGAISTIKRCKPILLISIYHTVDDFLDIKPMLEELNLGYKFKINKPVDGSIMLESTLIAEVYDD